MSSFFGNLKDKATSISSNLTRSSEKYGDVHFISFLGAILARLAYLNDNKFLKNYHILQE